MPLNTREMLARLVGFRTVSRDSNLDCIAFIRDGLAAHGIASSIIPNQEGTKANLYATIGRSAPAASCCPVIRMSCRWTRRPGRRIPGYWRSATGGCMGAGPAT